MTKQEPQITKELEEKYMQDADTALAMLSESLDQTISQQVWALRRQQFGWYIERIRDILIILFILGFLGG